MSLSDALTVIYILGFVVFAASTWADNRTTKYVLGEPPSPLWSGAMWPVILVISVGYWMFRREGN